MITTHILDISRGNPASGMPVSLEYFTDDETWREIGRGVADADGRVKDLVSDDFNLTKGIYRLTFDTTSYFAMQSVESFYPEVMVTFIVNDVAQHYHVPLLLSPFGFSTYRGS